MLIVNSWDAFLGGDQERGGRVSPRTTETVFCSGLKNPSVFVFVFICIFLELEELKGECFVKLMDEKS